MKVRFSKLVYYWRLLVILALLIGAAGGTPAPVPARAAPAETPYTLVWDGVTSFTADGTVVYWLSQPASCPLGAPQPTTIQRTRISSWEYRTVFTKTPTAGEPCPYQIYSNIVADSSYLYWVDTSGVVRFPVAGSPTAQPETLLGLYSEGAIHELAISNTHLWGYTGGNLWGMEKSNPSNNFAIGYTGPETSTNLQWDGKYLYMIRGPEMLLQRYTPQGNVKNIDSGVTTYATVGHEESCPEFTCTSHEYVYYVKQGFENALQRFDNIDNSYATPYTSAPPPGSVAEIYAVTAGGTDFVNLQYTKDVFFFEKQWVPCGCLETASTDFLRRLNLGVGPAVTIDIRPSNTSWHAANLMNSDKFLLWKDMAAINPANFGKMLRLPINAERLPSINLRVMGYHVTQGVQTPYNGIFLVRNRVTYFRLFVKSDGADVANVTARLTAYWDGRAQDVIAPVRPLMTVRKYYPDIGLENGFLFVMPREWLLHNDLAVEPILNPQGVPLEPNYTDNEFPYQITSFGIYPNPQARFHIVRMKYMWDNKYYEANDFNAIVSWLYRAYPIALEPGTTAAGEQSIRNDGLGKYVRDAGNTKECDYLKEDRRLCASNFLNDQLAALRREGVLPKSAYIYASVVGMARGSASSKDPVANGPDLIALNYAFEKAGYYAGHEIGHLLGRGHPNESSDDPDTPIQEGCGHDPGDPNFPYTFNWIGSYDNQVVAFDSGVGTPTGANRVLPYYGVHEVMGYCDTPDQWLSDYTYLGIYNFLKDHPAPVTPGLAQGAIAAAPLAGDWLDLSGRFKQGEPGAFTYARRVDSVTEVPALTPGGYTLRLVDAGGATLAEHAFTPAVEGDADGWLSFGLVVPFAAGTRQVQVIEDASGLALASLAISAGVPQVSAVELPGDVASLQGATTIQWSASDPEGDALSYDLLYSADGGLTFQPVMLGLGGTSVELDTSSLAGAAQGVFRIMASDGANTGYADSAPVEVAAKAPAVHILSPVDQQQVQYGTPLALNGFAVDAQDGNITSEGSLAWSSQYGPLGNGPYLSMDDLPTGAITLTLTAVNSAGLAGSASVRVVVGDDLYGPPPRLAADPVEINLQSPGEAPAAQSASLFLLNGGSPGNMDWTASSDSPWLTLSSLLGSLPFTLTVTANPAGLPSNSTHDGSIIVVSGEQSVVVPVHFQLGAGVVWEPPIEPTGGRKVFLPITFR